MLQGSHDVLKRRAWGCPVTLSLAYATEAKTLKLRVMDSRNGSNVSLSASQPPLYHLTRNITTELAAQLLEEVKEGIPARALSEEDKLQEALRSIMIRKVQVLSTTTREEGAEEMIRQFSMLALHSLWFTKLDESGSLASLFNLVVRSSLPLSYLTTGQRVPEDVEVATAERIVDLFWHGFGG
jgi:signal recognition particle GTPase